MFGLACVACGENDSLEIDTNDTSDESNETDESDDSSGGDADSGVVLTPEDRALLDVKAYVAQELDNLHEAALAIQAAAPEADDDGWNAQDDEDAVSDMRSAWKDARNAYERVEGAIAVLFPNYDASTDERYDGFIEEEPDDNLFDDEGVVGVHAIERILWAQEQPDHVVEFESALPNYQAASFPASSEEASAFREELVQRLVDDTKAMVDQFKGLALDPPSAFRGVIGSIEEQIEKINLAATGEDESRYAQHTLGDMRANAAGGRKIFEAFVPWLEETEEGEQLRTRILEGFDDLIAYYDEIDGDAIPAVPEGWNPDEPSEEHLDTNYGKLFTQVSVAADATADDSLVHLMLQAADVLEIADLE
jgi:iron uptake system component EfeO